MIFGFISSSNTVQTYIKNTIEPTLKKKQNYIRKEPIHIKEEEEMYGM